MHTVYSVQLWRDPLYQKQDDLLKKYIKLIKLFSCGLSDRKKNQDTLMQFQNRFFSCGGSAAACVFFKFPSLFSARDWLMEEPRNYVNHVMNFHCLRSQTRSCPYHLTYLYPLSEFERTKLRRTVRRELECAQMSNQCCQLLAKLSGQSNGKIWLLRKKFGH